MEASSITQWIGMASFIHHLQHRRLRDCDADRKCHSRRELTGEIDGRVVDTTGAVVPNVSVVIRNEDQKIVARTVDTNATGQFTVPLLPLGRYSVSVAAQGFRPWPSSLMFTQV